MTAKSLTISTLLLALLVGCGNHSGPTRGAATAAITTGTTGTGGGPTPLPTAVDELHGTLVRVTGVTGDPELAFLADGASEALEIVDPAALVKAKALPGRTLSVDGTTITNTAGQTTLTEVVDLSSFTLDEVAATGSVIPTRGGLLFETLDKQKFLLTGTLAATLQAQLPSKAPFRITGHRTAVTPTPSPKPLPPAPKPAPIKPYPIKPYPIMPPLPRFPALVVTSFAETTVCSYRVSGGMIGMDDSLLVEDLDGTGAYAYGYRLMIMQNRDRLGDGYLGSRERFALEAALTQAHVHSLPPVFKPQWPVLDAPHTTIELWDAAGRTKILVQAGAQLPKDVQALVQTFRSVRQSAATYQVLAEGSFSRVTKPLVQVIDNDADLLNLWRQMGTKPGSGTPRVDFTRQRVVALFMGRKPSGGWSIEVSGLDKVGDEVQLAVHETAPAPGTIVTKPITSPFQAVVVDLAGTTEIYVDGARQ